MSLRLKIGGLVALAAILAVLGTFGLSTPRAADAAVVAGSCTPGTTPTNCTFDFSVDEGADANISITASAGLTVTLVSCTIDADADGSVADEVVGNCNAGAGDDNAAANILTMTAARVNALDAGTTDSMFRIVVSVTGTCTSGAGTAATVAATQGTTVVTSNTVAVVCGAAAAATATPLPGGNVIRIAKVDQFGNPVSATFSIQRGGVEVFRAIVGSPTTPGFVSTSNPCTVPTQTNCIAPAATTSALPDGTYTVVEVVGPSNCTLVEVRSPAGETPPGIVFPFAYGAQVTFAGGVTTPPLGNDLTFVNSCNYGVTPNLGQSSLQIVIGGASFGVTNRRNVEIYPAPGSDDDARGDIRVRDSNGNPVAGAHVTVLIDKGVLWMGENTLIVPGGTSGYNVVEPSSGNLGAVTGGDTCDQTFSQSTSSGTLTNFPFFTASRQVQDGFTNNDGILSFCVSVNPDFAPGITPGTINVTAIVESPGMLCIGALGVTCTSSLIGFPNAVANIVLTGTITVVGPPASVTVSASPTTVNCGEKATITVTVKDSIGQNVSDNTQVEVISNVGSTIGGTGSTLGFPGVPPVGPLSSAAAHTVNGVATAFLLTSTNHVGPYEVVVSAGATVGSFQDWFTSNILGASSNIFAGIPSFTSLINPMSVPAGAPIVSQVTVNCTLPGAAAAPPPAPPVQAPRTGQGPSILPPNTGDAGLATSSSSSLALFGIAGAIAFALAGVASVKFARR